MREGVVVSLVLPLFNEAEGVERNVAALTEALEEASIPYELVLVDNGSTDQTGLILAELASRNSAVHVARIPINEGYGWGILCGLKEATGEIVGFMCADGQVAPKDIVRVYRRLVDNNVDLSKVVRISRKDGFKRVLMSAVYNWLFRFMFGIKARDINGTPKLMWRSRYAELNLTSRDWFIDAELMIDVGRRDWEVSEVEVAFLPRNQGDSSVRVSTSLEFIRNMLSHWYRSRGDRV